MSNLNIAVVIKAVDEASMHLAKIKNELNTMGGTAAATQGKVSGFRSALSGIASTAAGVVGGLMAFQAVQGVVGGLQNSIIGFNASMEQSQIAWETMLGSADAAKVMLRDLQQFAANPTSAVRVRNEFFGELFGLRMARQGRLLLM